MLPEGRSHKNGIVHETHRDPCQWKKNKRSITSISLKIVSSEDFGNQIEAKRKTWPGSTGTLNHVNFGREMSRIARKKAQKGVKKVPAVIDHFYVCS